MVINMVEAEKNNNLGAPAQREAVKGGRIYSREIESPLSISEANNPIISLRWFFDFELKTLGLEVVYYSDPITHEEYDDIYLILQYQWRKIGISEASLRFSLFQFLSEHNITLDKRIKVEPKFIREWVMKEILGCGKND